MMNIVALLSKGNSAKVLTKRLPGDLICGIILR